MVGGPDWPTGVLCGILRVSLTEVIIGSLPVFPLGIFPQTLVGALMTKGSHSNIWSTITTACTAIAVVAQVGSGLVATRETLKIIEDDAVELAKWREEHAKVAELTAREAEYNQTYARVTAWEQLSVRRRLTVLCVAAFQLVAGFMFAMDFVLMDPVCFKDFALNDTIENALDGNAMSMILVPLGLVSLCIWFAGLFLHIAHSLDLARLASETLREQKQVQATASRMTNRRTAVFDGISPGSKQPQATVNRMICTRTALFEHIHPDDQVTE